MTAPASESHRRLRFFVELRVRFILLDGSLTGMAFVSSLSESDLFVETDGPLPIGTLVRMRVYVPGKAAVDVRGVVRRLGEGKQMRGMRIEFTEVSPEARQSIGSYLAPTRKRLLDAPETTEEPAISGAGEADSLELSTNTQGKVLQFIETLDAATVRALLNSGTPLSAWSGAARPMLPEDPAHVPAPFESVSPALFDAEQIGNTDALPIVIGSAPSVPSESADEAERLRQKYSLDDSLFDVDKFREKYKIADDLFDDAREEPAQAPVARSARPIPPWPDASAAAVPQPPRVEKMVEKVGQTLEQRKACAQELRARGEEALARGLTLKAASDLGLAVAFDGEDASLVALYESVRAKASVMRADDHFNQGLQQAALGDANAAARLLLAACQINPQKRYVLTCAKVLFQIKTPDALKESRVLLRTALEREPDSVDYLLLYGRTAEEEGFQKSAVRSYQRVLELDPQNAAAKDHIRRLERK